MYLNHLCFLFFFDGVYERYIFIVQFFSFFFFFFFPVRMGE